MRSLLTPPTLRLLIASALALGLAGPVAGQGDAAESVHWAYAAFFGTGSYSVGGQQARVFGLRPRQVLTAAETDESNKRRPGLTLRLPFAIGLHSINGGNLTQTAVFEQRASTLSIVPGIELPINMRDRWDLKPVAHLGYGAALDSSDHALIYWAGLKSRFRFGNRERQWALVNSLIYLDHSQSAQHVFPFLTGLEYRMPLDKRRLGDDPVDLHWHLAHTQYLNELIFDLADRSLQQSPIASEWEIGVAFSKRGQRLSVGRLSWDRVGVAYQFERGGDFSGIRLVFHSLFDG
jgi:hypothetical protein